MKQFQPFGFRVIADDTGDLRLTGITQGVSPALSSPIYRGSAVAINTNGTLETAAPDSFLAGIFSGVEYVATNNTRNSGAWPGTSGLSPQSALFYPAKSSFSVIAQADGPVNQDAIGRQAVLSNATAGNMGTQLSGQSITVLAPGETGQFYVEGLYETPGNVWGNQYPILKLRFTQSIVGNFLYFDANAAPGGDGTIAAPYNGFAPLAALSGDLGGLTIRLRGNATFRERLLMLQCNNFTIEAYGGGTPVLSGANVVNPASWTANGGGVYYLSGIVKNHAVHPALSAPLTPVANSGALVAGTQFFDSGASRLYVRLPGDTDPAAQTVEITQRAECMRLEECSDYYFGTLHAEKGEANNISLFRTGNNAFGSAFSSDLGGSWDANDAGNGLFITGTSAAVRASNVLITDYTSNFNKNNHLEFWWLNGAIFAQTTSIADGNGFEPWAACTNVTIRRHLANGTTGRGNSTARRRGLWMVGDDVAPGTTGGHGTIRVEASIFANIDGNAFEIADGIAQIYNNTVFNCGSVAIPEAIVAAPSGTANAGVVLRNNIVMDQNIDLYYLVRVAPASVAFSSSNNNIWYCTRGFDTFAAFVWGASNQSNGNGSVAFAAHQAATGQDASSQFANPLLVNGLGANFALQAGSPAIGYGAPAFAPAQDYNGSAYANPPSVGAIEY